MKKYELSISENYVSSWGIVEAIREIFQNALDQEVQAKEAARNNPWDDDDMNPNKMFCRFGGTHITIGNKKSRLDVNSLLLGETSKANDSATIGKFGEGYKLALLTLTRLGKQVKIYNYGSREVWEAKLRPSKKYEGARTLQIEIQDKYIWQTVPNNDLTYVIDGLTGEDKEAIIASNLNLQDCGEKIETYYGDILCDNAHAGKLYVSGLFIQYNDKIQFGYNFKPEHIELDRDRRMIGHFDLTWKTSEMWKESGDLRIVELAQENAEDVRYVRSETYRSFSGPSKFQVVAEAAFTRFRATYGEKAFPVVTQREMDQLLKKRGGPDKVKPIVVYEPYLKLLESSEMLQQAKEELPPETATVSPAAVMYAFYDQVRDKLDGNDLNELWTIMLASQNWRDMG